MRAKLVYNDIQNYADLPKEEPVNDLNTRTYRPHE